MLAEHAIINDVYDFLHPNYNSLQKVLEDIVKEILKETVDCFFSLLSPEEKDMLKFAIDQSMDLFKNSD